MLYTYMYADLAELVMVKCYVTVFAGLHIVNTEG